MRWVIIVAVAYVLLRPALEQAAEQAQTTGSVVPPARTSSGEGFFRASIPGVGTYTNVYGNGTELAFNPALLERLFGSPRQAPEYTYAPVMGPSMVPTPEQAPAADYWSEQQFFAA